MHVGCFYGFMLQSYKYILTTENIPHNFMNVRVYLLMCYESFKIDAFMAEFCVYTVKALRLQCKGDAITP
ncbi:hypothetical protein PRBRB14_25980 [Hallella multisaccharivorax DSM 17128]|nr:hypothetical protein PRBRB14_25980 [Hallella multisaccharivorax DSM 17128]